MKMTLEEKWKDLIEVAKRYWVDSEPTGISDAEFDRLEREAANDGLFVRDFVINKYLKGVRTKNHYIDKIKKFKVEGSTMLDAAIRSAAELGIPEDEAFLTPKYDGSSIAIYIDPSNGKPKRVVTVGNLNTEDYGIDQTWKLLKLLPKRFPLGLTAIQCEALVDVNRLTEEPERARQKANGLINSKYCDAEVSNLLTLRAYRYYSDDSYYGNKIKSESYKTVLASFPIVKSPIDGHITFAASEAWSISDLKSRGGDLIVEHDIMDTATGKFMADGIVLYNNSGQCQRALKFAGAGSGTEAIKTKVLGIQWNDQSPKGKDSWSANVLIDPVVIKGCTIKKPSAGSVSKLIKNNVSVGAEIGIILANSTIPMVGEVFSQGNGNFMWPTCNCGHVLNANDTYGSLIKCGNPMCTERMKRMRASITEPLNLDTFLVIDRFKWDNTTVNLDTIKGMVKSDKKQEYYEYLKSFLKSDLQKKNLDLVWEASWTVLKEVWSH